MHQHPDIYGELIAQRRRELERAADETRKRRGKPHWHRRQT